MVLYIKLGQEVEQEVLRKGKPNKLGFGSYKADNTELIRPYQQESSNPIGRAYPMGIVSGAPTVYDPRAGIKEDPVVMLLKRILGMKTVVDKAPDAGFKNNLPFGGGGDSGMGGGGGGNVVVGNTLGQMPAGQRPNEYQDSELSSDASTTVQQRIGNWLDRVKLALDNFMWEKDSSVIEGSAFGGSIYGTATQGSEYGTATQGTEYGTASEYGSEYSLPVMPGVYNPVDDLEILHDMYSTVMKASLAENEAMRKKFGEINAYYGAMAIAIGLAPYEVMASLQNADHEEKKELANEIFEAFKANVIEQAAEMNRNKKEVVDVAVGPDREKRRASVLIENLRKKLRRDYSAPTSTAIWKDKAPIGPGQRRPGFPETPRIIGPEYGPRNRRRPLPTGLTINTGINQYEPYELSSSKLRRDMQFRMDWYINPKSSSSTSSSGSSFAPSPTDGRRESGKRTSPVTTRSKGKK